MSLVISKNFFFKVMKIFCNWWHHFFLLKIWKISIHPSWFFFFLKGKKKDFFFIYWSWLSWLNNSCCKTKRGAEFWPPFIVFSFSFFFAFRSSFFLLPLGFSPSLQHFFSKKITFLSFSTFLHSSPSISFKILVFLVIFATHPFCETHFQTFFFFALPMASSSNRPSFLTFNGKKYHPSPKWNDEEGLLQDPKTHAPHSKLIFYLFIFF